MKVESNKGTINNNGGRIKVSDGHDVLILLKVKPYYKASGRDVDQLIADLLRMDNNYEDLLESHKKIHGELYKKVQLNLNPSDSEMQMFSETLVKNAREKTSPGIIQRQFEAARYNILCASGINPPNLQGIWSGTWSPPWSSDFTHDGNVQVAVSHFLNGNMPELIMGYFNHHEKLLPHYRTNAWQFYGFGGIHVPSHTSTHGYNNHFDETWTMEYWNGGAAWASSIFYDYYLYTLDTTFLKERAFPFMNEALTFWENFLITDEKGMYVSVPSYSPENNPLEHRWQNCINATMDFALFKELVRNWVNSSEILGVDQSEIQAKREMLDRIPQYQISSDGVIKEWQWPGFTDNQSHRHASHLYGLYEVPDKDIMESDALIKAAQETIHQRMKIRKQQQGGEMSFGMCLLGNAAVRIGDESTATEIIEYLSKYYWTNSMATTHNPGNLFNMDISGGFPSLITRMLVNSEPGKITVLPALPDEWKTGDIKGVRARGNIEVKELFWDESGGKIVLSGNHNQEITMHVGEQEIDEFNVDGASIKGTAGNAIELNLEKDNPLEITWSYM